MWLASARAATHTPAAVPNSGWNQPPILYPTSGALRPAARSSRRPSAPAPRPPRTSRLGGVPSSDTCGSATSPEAARQPTCPPNSVGSSKPYPEARRRARPRVRTALKPGHHSPASPGPGGVPRASWGRRPGTPERGGAARRRLPWRAARSGQRRTRAGAGTG